MKKINLIFVVFLIIFQSPQAQENILGIGIIMPALIYSEAQGLNVQNVVIDLYDTSFIATGDCLHQSREEGVSQLVLSSGKASWIKHDHSGLVWVGYKSHAIQFYEETAGFIRIYLGAKEYWIKKQQLQNYDFEWLLWPAYYKGLNTGQLECIYNMNMREAPRSGSKKIALLQKNKGSDPYHLMQLTGRFDGLWAEVSVRVWDSMNDACATKKEPVKFLKGWIKYLDDTGFPNIFHIPTPCC